jgi:hypothetical protein
MSAAELLALAEKCEAAEGPDRDLDRAIMTALGGRRLGNECWEMPDGALIDLEISPLGSLDACRQLHERVLTGWPWSLTQSPLHDGRLFWAGTFDGGRGQNTEIIRGAAQTPELAWTAAILRALAARLP